MVRSMTGYGRGEECQAGFRFVVEIKALNHRHRDIIIRMPRDLSGLEDQVRRLIQERLSRGRFEVFVTFETTDTKRKKVIVDKELAKAYFDALEALNADFSLAKRQVTANELALFPEVLFLEKDELDLETLAPVLQKALSDAISALMRQRNEEGLRLAGNISLKLDLLKQIAENIKDRSPEILNDYRQRLMSRLEELHSGKEFDQQRFFTEVSLFAERCSIDEEIVRLESHIQAFYDDLQNNEVIGRKLDFLLQEMNREVNTISVKGNDLAISHLAVEAKSEIEKIREQIQNIE